MTSECIQHTVPFFKKNVIDEKLRPIVEKIFHDCLIKTEDFSITVVPPQGTFEERHEIIMKNLIPLVYDFRQKNKHRSTLAIQQAQPSNGLVS